MKTLVVNLDLKPENRWQILKPYQKEIEELMQYYLEDFEGAELIFEFIDQYKDLLIPTSYLEEIQSIAEIISFSSLEVLVANLYYDILKSYFGCTAFAVQKEDTIFHARNLDWHTENNLLGKYSTLFEFQKGGETIFKSVGWKGFIGVLSGTKPAKFTITLNAVLSQDNPELAYPISFLIRDVLENANSFSEAKQILEGNDIASDCLLLLSGIQKGEMIVVERTPKRFATRVSATDFIIVTNDYKKLEDQNNLRPDNLLSATSCSRYDKANLLLESTEIKTADHCMRILQDEEVMMGITVQQMVFNNKTGDILAVKAGG